MGGRRGAGPVAARAGRACGHRRSGRATVSRGGGAAPMTTTHWRGRLTDDEKDDSDGTPAGASALPIDESVPRRREARALLMSLLRPYRWTVAVLALVVVVENTARLSVPIL